MRNTVHRHEPPVVGRPLKVLADDGEVLVVDKPASIPVHPCGRFRHNTVIFILGKERGISELHTVHRLDRLTSGVLLFARTLEASKKLDKLVRDRQVRQDWRVVAGLVHHLFAAWCSTLKGPVHLSFEQMEKEYVCRVEGEFPDGELICEEPILVVSFKIGLCRVDPKGKECRTVFQRLSFNGKTSTVRCLPLTGRTHQIRVHLQYLGFPILNDPIYGSSAWGPHRGKGGQVEKTNEELLQALVEEHQTQESLDLLDVPDNGVGFVQEGDKNKMSEPKKTLDGSCEPDKSGEIHQTQMDGHEIKINTKVPAGCSSSSETVEEVSKSTSCKELSSISRESQCPQPSKSNGNPTEATQKTLVTADHLCSECKLVRADPTEKELIMYLHALRYKGPGFEYSTCLPEWAKEDWVEDESSWTDEHWWQCWSI